MSITFSKKSIFWDMVIIIAMSVLLYYGASWQFSHWYSDVGKYQCYGEAFLHGTSILPVFPTQKIQCVFVTHPGAETVLLTNKALISLLQSYHMPSWLITFVSSQSPNTPLHSLPHEYPLLTVLLFLPGLLAPVSWYQVLFALLMLIGVVAIYMLLYVYRSQNAARAFALYVVVGGWSVALARYDVVPALLTLVALLSAERRKWRWSFAFLALATMLKFYPIVFVPALLIAQHKSLYGAWRGTWRTWRRSLRGLDTYIYVCLALTLVSLLLSVDGTLGPLGYFDNRPIQAESLASSILWLGSFLGYQLHYVGTYGSLNVLSSLSSFVSPLFTLVSVFGLLYTFWLQLRGRVTLSTSFLLILLVVLCTGKVFSPQYLLWICPFVAYVGEDDWRWLSGWTVVSSLTTWIFPYIYTSTHVFIRVATLPAFYPVVTTRNICLVVITVMLFYHFGHKHNNTDGIPSTQVVPVREPEAVMLLAQHD